jgi:PKD repeat protein
MYAPGKILIMGGGDPPTNSAETIDLNVGGGWRPTGSMQFRRRHLNATVLPDGRVLVVGGTQGTGFNDESQRVLAAEVWDPSTGMWTTLASMQIGRQYHSSAVLLPDARILVAGGGRCAACLTDHRDAELFSPPYLYGPDGSPAGRPVISSAATSVGYGQSFAVSTPDAANITRVTWVRLPSTTHSFNQNQWFNELSFTAGSGGLAVTAPPNAYQAPPGHYMLYILNGSGVPSVAKVVQLTGSAALPDPPGIPAAPSGLSPLDQTIALSWVDNSTSETAFHIERCQEATCSDFVKVGSVGPNVFRYRDATVTPGTTYRYRVRAENGAGFSPYSNTATATASTGPAALPIVNRLSGRCADVQWAGRAPGTPVVIWDCQQVPNQSFALQSVGVSGAVQVYGSMCLDVAGGAGTDGAGIVIQNCTGVPSQVWTLTAANQLRGINGKCIDLTSSGTANGTLLVLGTCATTANQQWKSVTGNDRPSTPVITASCTGLGCTFDSSGSTDDVGITSRSWDFGDGTTAGNLISALKDYQVAGTYVVTLGTTDDSWQTARERVSITVTGAATPSNNPPVAAFTQSCTGLTCAFTDGSTDGDGSVVARSWTFGDGATSSQTNPSRTYAAAGTYTVTLTVTDDDGASNSTSKSITVTAPPPPPSISLTATPAKVKGIQQVTLRWSGATTTSVQVRRTGTTSATFDTPNDGLEVINLNRKGSATYTYQVCEVGTSKCSAEVPVVFN